MPLVLDRALAGYDLLILASASTAAVIHDDIHQVNKRTTGRAGVLKALRACLQ